LPETFVKKILFKGKTAVGVEYTMTGSNATSTVAASKEVVLAGGSIHTPQILQISGIGPSALLKSFNIEVVSDLPGVGQNFQDNPTLYPYFKCESCFRNF
jgi:choline dehydrogenase